MNTCFRHLWFHGLLVLALLLGGCASRPSVSVRQGTPEFDPMKFFPGRAHSWGVFETRSGQPKSVIETFTRGRLAADGLHFEQDVVMETGKKSHRSWLIRRVDGGHDAEGNAGSTGGTPVSLSSRAPRYTATGTGIVGVARGTTYGNVFHLEFTMDALKGNPLGHVHMSQWMYLQADGRTMINRAFATKSGITVAEITEYFHKDR